MARAYKITQSDGYAILPQTYDGTHALNALKQALKTTRPGVTHILTITDNEDPPRVFRCRVAAWAKWSNGKIMRIRSSTGRIVAILDSSTSTSPRMAFSPANQIRNETLEAYLVLPPHDNRAKRRKDMNILERMEDGMSEPSTTIVVKKTGRIRLPDIGEDD